MSIRKGTEADIVKVSRLWRAMVKEMRPEWTPNVEWWRKMATANMRAFRYGMFVNDEGGKINAFVDFFLFPEPSTGKIHGVGQHLFVDPGKRNSGLGAELVKAAEEEAILRGAKFLELMCFEGERGMWETKGYAPVRTMMRKEVNGNV